MSRIPSLPLTPPTTATAASSPGLSGVRDASAPDFKELLIDSLKQVNTMQADADRAVEQMMAGGQANPAEVLTAVQKADLAFKLMLQIRNKLVSAYQEIKDVRI